MTGPEHYREAERLNAYADHSELHGDDPYRTTLRAQVIAQAQVHATLALAAATATPLQLSEPAGTVPGGEAQHWFEVL